MKKSYIFVVTVLLAMPTNPGFGRADDPVMLLEQAKQALQTKGEGAQKAIPLLEQANALWEKAATNPPEYAESLDLLVLSERHPPDLDAWREKSAPLAKRALAIREAHPDTSAEDMALALELQADILGRSTEEGTELWKRAMELRAKHIADMQKADPPVSDRTAITKLGSGVTAPQVDGRVQPQYPEAARLGKYTGASLLAIVVDVDGQAKDIVLRRSCGFGLDEKAMEAVKRWHFKPAMKDGRPVPVIAQVEVNFRLL